MVILDRFDADCGHRRPVHATIVLPRHGIVVRHEDDAVAVVNAYGERARAVALQFLSAGAGKPADDGKIVSSIEVVEALANLFPALLSEPLPQQLVVVA